MSDQPGVKVTLDEIYKELLSQGRDLRDVRNVVGGQEKILEGIGERMGALEQLGLASFTKMVADHESRMRSLETRVYGILAAVVAALFGLSKAGVI